jgi:FKBP-type peptidyl-prolyl cis-trans isomerase FkpA
MKQKIFTLLFLSAIAFTSCRKKGVEPDIKQYDQSQIQSYISSNGLTGMIKDTSGGDTTGMYYKIIQPGYGVPLNYPDQLSLVFTIRSFDGKYVTTDTINNHFFDYLGHIGTIDNLPKGLELGILNILKYRGGSMRLLIPSHLAYGVNGFGTGSSQNTNTRILGNQCLDYYIHVIGAITPGLTNSLETFNKDQATYDDLVINNYIKANNLSGYTKVQSGQLPGNFYYYSVLTPGTGAAGSINENSTLSYDDTGQLFNKVIIDSASNGATPGTLALNSFIPGVQDGLSSFATLNTKISFLFPSALAYGSTAQTSIPANSCLRFTFTVLTVTP